MPAEILEGYLLRRNSDVIFNGIFPTKNDTTS